LFGFWKVLQIKNKSFLVCLCTGCNVTTKEVSRWDLRDGRSKSCRCKQSEQLEKTCLDRYGLKNSALDPTIKAKRLETLQKIYGVTNAFQSTEIKEKSKITRLEKYGVENLSQLPSRRNKLKEWCDQHPESNSTSKSELELLSWMQQYYPSAKKLRKQGNELDIFIPELSLGIEFNGLFWHCELNKPNDYHINKTKFFKEQGIRTIHIFEHEWKHKQEQVKSFLLSALGKNEHKIGARKCRILWSSSKEEIQKAHDLLDSTHIQGHTNSTKYVANVYYKEILVATATFGKHHRNSKEWVLSRFTTKANYTIQGILSKISKLASQELKSNIVSWADYRLSEGNGYEKAGWRFESLLRPDYFYYTGGLSRNCVISKQSRQKKKVDTPKHLTEHEHALQDGLVRIYDCGKIRFIYKHIDILAKRKQGEIQ
jgi:hypothetical protein